MIAVSLTTFVIVKPSDVAEPEKGGADWASSALEHATRIAIVVRKRRIGNPLKNTFTKVTRIPGQSMGGV